MSLIQDALKRQQQEAAEHRVAAEMPAAPSPAPVPLRTRPPEPVPEPAPAPAALRDERLPPPEPGPRRSAKSVLGIVIFCLLLLWMLGLVYLYANRFFGGTLTQTLVARARSLVGATARPAAPSPAPAPADETPEPPREPVPAPAPSPAPAPPAAAPASAASAGLAPAGVAPPAGPVSAEPTMPAGPTLPADPAPPAAAAGPATPSLPDPAARAPEPRPWPKLTLSAVFAHAGSGRGGARLNNRLVRVGEQIEGVTLVDVQGDTVRLQFGSETRRLKSGMSL